MKLIEARDILLKIPNLTAIERKAVKTVVAMIDRKNSDSYYSLDLNDLPGEEWREIADCDGNYQASTCGRIKSFYDEVRILKASKRSDEYLSVRLYQNGQSSNQYVHVLVANTFLPKPEGKTEVNHIDGDKTNNRVENLAWSTRSENMIHAFKMGLAHATRGINHPNAKLTPDYVRYIRSHYIKGDYEFGAEALARKFDVTGSVIRDVVHGRSYVDIV